VTFAVNSIFLIMNPSIYYILASAICLSVAMVGEEPTLGPSCTDVVSVRAPHYDDIDNYKT